ncbi:MgtC/SapB family protein [Arenicella xantha]|uniref:Protein MgtC n=1 Tax=Arenicella xantha TaxID=644221 RepID=A0A395JFT1_9GAMM|nr:MgtC/SapB family protein [Arenicella xantha]RBP48706.1 putative Mg2+ transporter-C (MgtC) family protein [Arenicella xantha]
MMSLFTIDPALLATNLLQLLIAFVLPLFTAWERESESHTAGLRTFPLVSMAACSFTILAMTMFTDAGAQGRIVGGIVTGIGFIGGGAILKRDSDVSGTSTAAAIWSTGAVGIAVGLGRIEIAIALSFMTYICLKLFGQVKKEVKINNGD